LTGFSVGSPAFWAIIVVLRKESVGQMPWKKRGNKRFYYRSVRTPSGVRTIYVGGGMVGAAAAAADQLRRTEREQVKEKRQQIAADTASVDHLGGQLESLMKATLLASGFYQRARCYWKRRHYVKQR
jgi:hypothetical protein